MKHNHFLPFLFLTLFVLALACSCQNNYEHKRIIDLAERIVEEHPDSALKMLNGIQKETIISAQKKARYCVIKSMAYDKCLYNIKSDSLIRFAVDYYKDRKNYAYQMKAWYYLGITQLASKDTRACIYSFSKAENAANQTSNDKYKGLISMGFATSMGINYCHSEALGYIKKAKRWFNLAGDLKNYNITVRREAQELQSLHQWDQAASIYDSLLVHASTDTAALAKGLLSYAQMCMYKPEEDPKKCLELYAKAKEYHAPFKEKDWGVMALAYSKMGQIQVAEEILSQVESVYPDFALVSNFKALVARDKGDFKSAFEMLDKTYEVEGDIVRQSLSQSSIAAQRDYFEAQKKEEELVARKRALVIAQVLLASLITLGILVFSFTRRRGRDERRLMAVEQEKTKWQSLSERNSETLKVVADGRHAEQAELNQLRKERQRSALRNLQSRFKILGPLEVVYEENRNKHEFKREKIYQAVKRLLADYFGDEQAYRRLEKLVNTELDNFMKKLRSETDFSEKEYQIVCYDLLGLPAEQIAALTNFKKDSIYSLLTRMRTDIRQSNYLHREWFLVLLDSRSVVHMN